MLYRIPILGEAYCFLVLDEQSHGSDNLISLEVTKPVPLRDCIKASYWSIKFRWLSILLAQSDTNIFLNVQLKGYLSSALVVEASIIIFYRFFSLRDIVQAFITVFVSLFQVPSFSISSFRFLCSSFVQPSRNIFPNMLSIL